MQRSADASPPRATPNADFPPLASLGPRICILGPSNSGKSTLAVALSRKLGRPTVHLDQLHHTPNTDWVPRPREEFDALHAEAIAGETWVMDGNYSRLYPQRLSRATGIILLQSGRWPNFLRYLRRTLFQKQRAGMLEGGRDSLKWSMMHWILIGGPKRLQVNALAVDRAGLPHVRIGSMRELKALYRAWGLRRG